MWCQQFIAILTSEKALFHTRTFAFGVTNPGRCRVDTLSVQALLSLVGAKGLLSLVRAKELLSLVGAGLPAMGSSQ